MILKKPKTLSAWPFYFKWLRSHQRLPNAELSALTQQMPYTPFMADCGNVCTPSGWRHYDIEETVKLPLRNGVFQNNRNDSSQLADVGWGDFSCLMSSGQLIWPLYMSTIRVERIFSLSQNFTGKAGRILEREREIVSGSRQCIPGRWGES